MARVRESIEIAAPLEHVFEYVADSRNALKWMHGFDKFEPLSSQSRGLGARASAAGTLRGFRITTELEIVEFVPNKRIVSVSTSGPRSTSAWLFEPTERGTVVTFEARYELPHGIVGGIAGSMWLRSELSDHTWKSLVKLKRALESSNRPSSESVSSQAQT